MPTLVVPIAETTCVLRNADPKNEGEGGGGDDLEGEDEGEGSEEVDGDER